MLFWVLARIQQHASRYVAARLRAPGPGPAAIAAGPRRIFPPRGNPANAPGPRDQPPLPPFVAPPGAAPPRIPSRPDLVITAKRWGTRR